MKRGGVSKSVRKKFKVQFKDKKKKKNKGGPLDITFGDETGSMDEMVENYVRESGYDSWDEYQRDMLDMTSDNIFRDR